DRRDALSGIADAARRHRALERGAPGAARHPRFHDRYRSRQASRGGRLMDGVHDMGGMDGFGKVEPEPNEPVFHAPWEGRVLAMQRAMGYAGAWQIDMSRFAQERLPPRVYLAVSYYQRWALAMEKNVVERGYAQPDELAAGHALRPGRTLPRKLAPEAVAGLTPGSFYRQARAPPPLKPGAPGRPKDNQPPPHPHPPAPRAGRP